MDGTFRIPKLPVGKLELQVWQERTDYLPTPEWKKGRFKMAIKPGSWNLLAKCEQVAYLSPLWRERYPRLAKVMDQNPLMPLGNSIRNNILAGCKKPFAISKGIEEDWLGRENDPEWSMEGLPFLPDEGSTRDACRHGGA